MFRFSVRTTCSALALAVMAGTAQADLTAQQVWDDLEAYLQGFGYTVAAKENATGNGLNLSEVTISMTLPEDEGTMSISMSDIMLSENGDGTVAIGFPSTMPIALSVAPKNDDKVDMVLDYTNDNLAMTVSEAEGGLAYDYAADRIGLQLASLMVNGEAVTRDMARAEFSMEGVEGKSVSVYGDLREVSQTLTASSARYDTAFNDPDTSDSALVSGKMESLLLKGHSAIPQDFDPARLAEMASSGFAARGSISYSNGSTEFAVTDRKGTTSGHSSTSSAGFAMDMNAEHLVYRANSTNLAVQMTGPEIPVPIDVGLAAMEINAAVPTTASDSQKDIEFGLMLGGFSMSELLWNVADPGKVFSHAPATVAIDLVGKVTPFVSIYDAEAMAELEKSGNPPGELNALTLRNLLVDAVGARLTGKGDFTFDNTDMETFDGFPRPTGSVELSLTGANALIDKLIQIGVMSEDDAMGARMMMSMFAVPGEGEDSLNSKLEINEQGHVLANGMRIQ